MKATVAFVAFVAFVSLVAFVELVRRPSLLSTATCPIPCSEEIRKGDESASAIESHRDIKKISIYKNSRFTIDEHFRINLEQKKRWRKTRSLQPLGLRSP